MRFSNAFSASGVAMAAPQIGVRIAPGETTLTRILRGDSSDAITRAIARTPALLARIGRIAGIAEHRNHRTVQDDRGAVIEMRDRGLHREKDRGEVGPDDFLECLERLTPSGVPPAIPALANTMSSLPNFLDRLLDRRFRRRDVGGIGDNRKRVRPEFLRRRLQRRLVPPGDDDAGALLHEQLAVARPMPLFPPVMNAVLFASLTGASML